MGNMIDINTIDISEEAAARALNRAIILTEIAPIPGFPGYFATRRGHLFSYRQGPFRMLKTRENNRGYEVVDLRRGGRYVKCHVGRLVALAFLGEPEDGAEASHLDGHRGNNALANLKWESSGDNKRRIAGHAVERAGQRRMK